MAGVDPVCACTLLPAGPCGGCCIFALCLGERYLFIYGGCGSGQTVWADWCFLHTEELRWRQVWGQAGPLPAWEECWEAVVRAGVRGPPSTALCPCAAAIQQRRPFGCPQRMGSLAGAPLPLASSWAHTGGGGGRARDRPPPFHLFLPPPQIPVEGPLPVGRHSHSACGWAGGALVAGGLDATERPLGSVLCLRPTEGGFQWCPVETRPPLAPR